MLKKKMEGFKKVTESEFNNFIKEYDKRLEKDVFRACDPPFLTYNDFSADKIWPESIVAKVCLNSSMKYHPLYDGESDEYYIKIK